MKQVQMPLTAGLHAEMAKCVGMAAVCKLA